MEIPGAAERARELREIERKYPHHYYLVLGTGLILIAVSIGYLIFGDDGYPTNVFTEVLSVAFTILVLNRLAE